MKHFTLKEFACHCGCGACDMSQEFLARLDATRDRAGVPFVVTSGYRCMRHNKAVGGATDSGHTRGMAADIACVSDRDRFKIVDAALACGLTRIGTNDEFVHLAMAGEGQPGALWVY